MLLQDWSFLVDEVVSLDSNRYRRFASLGMLNANHPSTAANIHVLRERDFGGHYEGHFNHLALGQRKGSPEHRPARLQVLSKTGSATALIGNPQRNGGLIWKTLSTGPPNPHSFCARQKQQTDPKQAV